MGEIVIKPTHLSKSPGNEHITRIMHDDNEPPKNYLWRKPDGFLYKWNGKDWVKLNVPSPEPDYGKDKFVSKSYLDNRLKLLKNEIISYLTALINMRDGADTGESAIAWVNENVIPDLRRLQEIDHSAFLTPEDLANYYTKDEIDSKTLDRDAFEQLALDLDFVKVVDITLAEYQQLQRIEPNVIYNITDADAYHYDDTALSNRVGALESDVAVLKGIDHTEFVTVEQDSNSQL